MPENIHQKNKQYVKSVAITTVSVRNRKPKPRGLFRLYGLYHKLHTQETNYALRLIFPATETVYLAPWGKRRGIQAISISFR